MPGAFYSDEQIRLLVIFSLDWKISLESPPLCIAKIFLVISVAGGLT